MVHRPGRGRVGAHVRVALRRRGDPYPVELSAAEADTAFLDRLQQILDELGEQTLVGSGVQERELTDGMRRLRAAGFAARRDVYLRDRVEDQIGWYTRKADAHERAARRWLGVAAAASLAGFAVAVLRMVGALDLDLLGVVGACASAAIAWNQLNQNRNLVSAYRITAGELKIIRERLETVTEDRWAAFVSDAEDAVSREHTLWLARHGHPGSGSR